MLAVERKKKKIKSCKTAAPVICKHVPRRLRIDPMTAAA